MSSVTCNQLNRLKDDGGIDYPSVTGADNYDGSRSDLDARKRRRNLDTRGLRNVNDQPTAKFEIGNGRKRERDLEELAVKGFPSFPSKLLKYSSGR